MSAPTVPCRSCGAPIRWARTARGNAMPVDAEPNPEGNVVLTENEKGLFASVRVAGSRGLAEARAAGPVYMPHHATCPDGRSWRRENG